MKIPDTELRDPDLRDPGLLDFIDYTRLVINDGRYQLRVVSSIPDWTGQEGDAVLYAAGNVRSLYAYINGTWKNLSWAIEGVEFTLENRTDDPSTPATGQMWLRTDI